MAESKEQADFMVDGQLIDTETADDEQLTRFEKYAEGSDKMGEK